MSKNYLEIRKALNLMDERCDGAFIRDGKGYNKGHSYQGKFLNWVNLNSNFTYYHAITAYKLLTYYKGQLESNNIILEFPKNETNDKEKAMIIEKEELDMIKNWNNEHDERVHFNKKWRDLTIVEIDANGIIPAYLGDLNNEYFIRNGKICKIIRDNTPEPKRITIESLKEQFADIEGKFINTRNGEMILKKSSLPNGFWDLWKANKTELKSLGFSPSKYSGNWELSLWIPLDVEEEEEEIPEPEEDIIDIESLNHTNLYDYQKPHVAKLIQSVKKFGYALDGSGTGTGKTFSNLNVCKELGLKPLVICPKNVIPAWEKSIKILDMEVLGVVNYELIRTGKYRIEKGTISRGYNKGKPKKVNVNCPYFSVEKNTERKIKYDPKYIMKWNLPENTIIIFDEAHRCKNFKTQNTQMMKQASNDNCKILMLSATIGESPLKMAGIGRVMNFYEKDWEYYTKFVSSYGCYKNRFGWKFDGDRHHIKELNKEIYGEGKGSRMDTDELRGKGLFPETQILFEAYNMNGNESKINKAYDNMFKELAKRSLILDEIEKLSQEERTKEIIEKLKELRAKKASMDTPLAIRQKARQIAELEKVNTFVEMAQDYIEEGHSVAIFVNYTDSLKALCDKLKTDCCIYGGNNSSKNEVNRQAFEDNKARIIICNVAASREGIDLHDKHNVFSRVALVSPDDSAQNIKQVLGRVDRAGGTSSLQRIIFAAYTIEEEVLENARVKVLNMDTLNGVEDQFWSKF